MTPVRGDGHHVQFAVVPGQAPEGGVVVVADLAHGPGLPDVAVGRGPLRHLALFRQGAHQESLGQCPFGNRPRPASAEHVDLGELATVPEPVPLQEGEPPGVVLPGPGHQGTAPAQPGPARAGRRPAPPPRPAPPLRGPHHSYSGSTCQSQRRVLAQDGKAGQFAALVVPEADVLLGVQVADHHEEAERQLPDVGVAPVAGARPPLHQQAPHLEEVGLAPRTAGRSARPGTGDDPAAPSTTATRATPRPMAADCAGDLAGPGADRPLGRPRRRPAPPTPAPRS